MSAPVSSLRAVVFDRDGVLVRTNLQALLGDLRPLLPLDPAELGRRWRDATRAAPLDSPDAERTAVAAFLTALGQELDLPEEVRARLAAFDYGAYVEAYPDARTAIDEARRRGLKVGVLTNNSAGFSACGPLRAAGLDDAVDLALSAQEVGASKPAAAAYLAICRALEVDPEGVVFFDDVPAWVEGARAAGMRAYRVDRGAGGDDLAGRVLAGLGGMSAALDREVSR